MATTGELFPTVSDQPIRGGEVWSVPANIEANDGNDNTCDAPNGAGSNYCRGKTFGFDIPSVGVISGITVRAEVSEHSLSTVDLKAVLQEETGAIVGDTKQVTISGTTKAVYTFGGSADLWGETWTPAIINDADFGVRLWFVAEHEVRVDYVTIEVTYTATFALTATGIATGSPSVGAPALGQTHALTATGIATGAPSVGAPGTIPHALTATGIATGAPSVGAPVITQTHVLTATGVSTGTPVADTPSITSSGPGGQRARNAAALVQFLGV